jgi:hypothetical protein
MLKKENARLEKNNDTLRCLPDYQGGLAKNNMEARLKKFPWLSVKGKIEWEKFPVDIVFCILDFLCDKDLFDLRGLSSQFYEAFYSQKFDVDGLRALRLANKGRKFSRLIAFEHFLHLNHNDRHVLRALTPLNFPKLEVLSIDCSAGFSSMKSHSNIRELRFFLKSNNCLLKFVTDSKFPALEVLVIQWRDHPNPLQYLNGHKNLTYIAFSITIPSLEEIRDVKKDKFPRLRTIGFFDVCEYMDKYPEILDHFEQQGIEIDEEDCLKLSHMTRKYGRVAKWGSY